MTLTYLLRDGRVESRFESRYENTRQPPTDSGQFSLDHEGSGYARIHFTEDNAQWSGDGSTRVSGHITFGFRNVDLTNIDKVCIEWSHEGPSNNNQDRSFFGINRMEETSADGSEDALEMISRIRVRDNKITGPGIYHRDESFEKKPEHLPVSELSGNHAIGVGAQISTGGNEIDRFTVRIYNIWLEGEGDGGTGNGDETDPPSSPSFYFNWVKFDDDFFSFRNGALYVYGIGLLVLLISIFVGYRKWRSRDLASSTSQ